MKHISLNQSSFVALSRHSHCLASIKPQNAQEEINETMDKKNDVLLHFIRLLIHQEAPYFVITMQRRVFFFFFTKFPVPSEP